MKPRLAAPAILAAITLAGCATTPKPAPAPSATTLAHHLHCTGIAANTPAVGVRQDITCTMPGSIMVDIATFASTSAETHWIAAGGDPQFPDPAFGGCCVQGNGWAATVTSSDYSLTPVIRVLGGRAVTG